MLYELGPYLSLGAIFLSIASIAIAFWTAAFSRRAKNAELRAAVLTRASGLVLRAQEVYQHHLEMRVLAEELNSVALYKEIDVDNVDQIQAGATSFYNRISALPTKRGLAVYESMFHDIEQLEFRLTAVAEHTRKTLLQFRRLQLACAGANTKNTQPSQ